VTPVALLVAYSRIYCGSHWPSDALASLPGGVGLALLTLGGLEAVYRLAGRRRWPALLRPASQPVSQPVTVAAWTLTSTRDRVAFWIQLVVVFARRVCLNA
jgi:hypothetical protein